MTESADTQNTYRYEPLDLSKQQIRLIALEHSSFSGTEIACHLRVFDTATAPRYITLSYTWGPPAPTRTIFVERKALDIRQNLYDFLFNYRDDNNNRHYIWNDQICISQAHARERNHQVQQMSRIYSKCLHAIIWLGQESEGVARRFSAEPTQYFACIIFRNEYFKRLWIIQEIFLAPQARILCGRVWLSAEKLTIAAQCETEVQLTSMNFIDFILIDKMLWSKALMPLEVCLSKYASHECQDPRDKVYGLLSLIDEEQRVTVDYAKSVEDVFLDVVLILYKTSWMRAEKMENSTRHWLMTLRRQMGLHENGHTLLQFLHALDGVSLWDVTKLGFDTIERYGKREEVQWWYYTYDGTRFDFIGGHFLPRAHRELV